jgi:hypothetical protein
MMIIDPTLFDINTATKVLKLYENAERSILILDNEFILCAAKRNSILEELQDFNEIYSHYELHHVLEKFCSVNSNKTLQNCFDIAVNSNPVYELYNTGVSVHCNITYINRKQNAQALHFNVHEDNAVYIASTSDHDGLLTTKELFTLLFNEAQYKDLVTDISDILS